MRVGFIGLGSQGTPIAERIATSGIGETVVWARRQEALAPFRGGPAMIADSVAELGTGLDLLATCVFDADDTREVLFGPGGAAHTMPSGAIVICHSTVSPEEITEIGREAADRFGLRLLDAPVSGGAPKAAAGELVVMVGGDEATYRQALPVMATYSNLTVHLGPIGAGQQAKLLNNALLAAHIGLAHDLFDVGRRLGLDPAALGQVLRNGSGRSYGLDLFVASGSLEPMTHSPMRPTLTKDVELLLSMLEGWEEGAVLLAPAKRFIVDLAHTFGSAQRPPDPDDVPVA
jgi:3-hydroxyisobutyrate dehydrogenase-like beta-hydroxyacid dehydrogenase